MKTLLRNQEKILTVFPSKFELGLLRIDLEKCQVTYAGKLLHLTPKQYNLLALLLRHPQQVVSFKKIGEILWDVKCVPNKATIRSHVKSLRIKLKEADVPDLIETVHGVGYRLKIPVNQPSFTNPKPTETKAAIAQVWERFKLQILQRIFVIEQVVTTWLSAETISEELRLNAQQQAHTLSGSLGTFGFAEGSHIAREIEQILQSSLAANQALYLRELVQALLQEIELSNSGK